MEEQTTQVWLLYNADSIVEGVYFDFMDCVHHAIACTFKYDNYGPMYARLTQVKGFAGLTNGSSSLEFIRDVKIP